MSFCDGPHDVLDGAYGDVLCDVCGASYGACDGGAHDDVSCGDVDVCGCVDDALGDGEHGGGHVDARDDVPRDDDVYAFTCFPPIHITTTTSC